jgi:hypothetical protein
MGSLQMLRALHRRVAEVLMVVMAVKPVKSAEFQRGARGLIREILRETMIEKRRI